MIILTLNCGSSSVKYQVYDWANKDVLGSGVVERVGQSQSDLEYKSKGKDELVAKRPCPTHKEAIAWVMESILDPTYGCITDINQVTAVGHRIVHGGSVFTQSVEITDEVLAQFKKVEPLAPLHNPANIMGVEAARALLPKVTHCAILDTAWHQTMPDTAFMYALPHAWYDKHQVRRYGFHGSSFLYTSKRAALLLGKPANQTNLVICHIGNGASACAVKNGVSVDTSMGMTPLEGLVMGSRSGDIDPAIMPYMAREAGMSIDQLDAALSKESGLLGITGRFTDRRDVEDGVAKGEADCILAQNMEIYRIKKYIGAYAAVVGPELDAIVFTAGVGEFGADIRAGALIGMEHLGIKVDLAKNKLAMTRNAETCISADDSKVKVFVIPTDEEIVMTEDTVAISNGTYKPHTEYRYIFEEASYVNKAREAGLPKDLTKRPGLDKIIAQPKK
ncbi:acetate kinase [Entomospira culicis]|uniref:Acetate kinase n=1 Tax=Entomospira culicis TaxID=2719989 RepID=A0A968GFX2_9SPIO|nr:acetate kinase [Entomospira culicis]NIZ19528.1 acetate kinase [Entomospira culicis]NIZ69567.1 acetate kinase [Entomospira culicis]WDI36678.1 acetate kinase [Entomospira culicis]WDI38307.1 acetate kinase [Entomospira culicis]